MLVDVLTTLHNVTTLLFGVFVSAAFLGVKANRKNIFTLLSFAVVMGAVFVLICSPLRVETAEKIYPLVIHLPLCVFLSFFYKRESRSVFRCS